MLRVMLMLCTLTQRRSKIRNMVDVEKASGALDRYEAHKPAADVGGY